MNKRLAINSAAGKRSLEREEFAVSALKKFFEVDVARSRTGKAYIDGIMSKEGTITAVIEIKSRGLNLAELNKFKTGLVTEAKLQHGREVSMALQAPFHIVFLLKDDWVVIWEISDKHGKPTFEYKKEKTKTKRTVNGGEVMRMNGFLPVEEAMITFHAVTLDEIGGFD